MERAIAAMGLGNAVVRRARAEELGAEGAEGREAYDVVAARAVAPLAVLAELASPLLRDGGALVAWKGGRDPDEEGQAARAASRTAVIPERAVAVRPYPASRDRHIHVLRKNGPTPSDLPRRPGMAAKRPFGSE
jgi:16S rRNA (guanine527-N7)-methyltransferase